jgi:hypothetical protein
VRVVTKLFKVQRSLASIATRFAIAIAMLFASGTAAADDSDDAERLFREGQKLMEERLFGQACPKFEAAYAKDRALGTLINLAFCHKEQGAIWLAWLEFREAEVVATEKNASDRKEFAKQRLNELEKQLPKAVIDNPQKIPLTAVLVEDRKIPEAERSSVFAIEGGQRKFLFKARGKKATSALINITASKGEKAQHILLPSMEDGDDTPPPPPAKDPVEATKQPESVDANPGSTQRTIGWIAIGIGGVGLVVGTITGVQTLGSECANGKMCSDDQRSSAKSAGAIATVSFVVAGVAIVGGAALILTAGSSSTPPTKSAGASPTRPDVARINVTPSIGLRWAGLSGTF